MLENFREWLSVKLNPAQPSISSKENLSTPASIITYQTAYREVEIINRCVDIIISACVDIPIIVEGSGPSKKISKLINDRPNPFEDRIRFFRRAILDFYLDGNIFFYYDGSSIYILPANDVVIVPDSKEFVKQYEYTPVVKSNTYSYARKKDTTNIVFSPDEIIHVRADNDESIYRGQSKIKCLTRLIELYYALINFQKQFFENNAIPGMVLVTDSVLSVTVKDRLLAHWKQNYSNIFRGARSPAILDGGLKPHDFSKINFSELDFEVSVNRLQEDIAKSLGVPYVLLKAGNNSNIGNNEIVFYTQTVLPIITLMCSAFEQFFGPDVDIYPDKYAINALQPDLKDRMTSYVGLVNAGIIDVNEARKALRYEPKPGAENDQLRIPQNITGSATKPEQGGRPPGTPNESNTKNDNQAI